MPNESSRSLISHSPPSDIAPASTSSSAAAAAPSLISNNQQPALRKNKSESEYIRTVKSVRFTYGSPNRHHPLDMDAGAPQNAREAFESREAGRSLEIADDIEFLVDGLHANQSPEIKASSIFKLAKECASSDCRMYLRAHSLLPKIIACVQDAGLYPSLGLQLSALLYMLAKDSITSDLESSCVPLLVDLANPVSACNHTYTLWNGAVGVSSGVCSGEAARHSTASSGIGAAYGDRRPGTAGAAVKEGTTPDLVAKPAPDRAFTATTVALSSAAATKQYNRMVKQVKDLVSSRAILDDFTQLTPRHLALEACCMVLAQRPPRTSFRSELRLSGMLEDLVNVLQKQLELLKSFAIPTGSPSKSGANKSKKTNEASAGKGSPMITPLADSDPSFPTAASILVDMELSLRVLQNAIFLDVGNQQYLVHLRDNMALIVLANLITMLVERLAVLECKRFCDQSSALVAECMLAALRVLLGLTHNNEECCSFLVNVPDFVAGLVHLCHSDRFPSDLSHDGLVLILSLLVNLVEHNYDNRTLVVSCAGPSIWTSLFELYQQGAGNEEDSDVDIATKDDKGQESAGKSTEQKERGSGDDGKKSSNIVEIKSISGTKKSKEEKSVGEREGALSMEANKPGKSALNEETSRSIVAAYTAVLLSFLCKDHPDNQSSLELVQPRGHFGHMADHLQQFDAYRKSAGLGGGSDMEPVIVMLRSFEGQRDVREAVRDSCPH